MLAREAGSDGHVTVTTSLSTTAEAALAVARRAGQGAEAGTTGLAAQEDNTTSKAATRSKEASAALQASASPTANAIIPSSNSGSLRKRTQH